MRLTRPGLPAPANSTRPFAIGDVGGLGIRVPDPGEGGHADAARDDGISSHSCFAIVLTVRKNGHRSVSSWREA